MEHIDVAHGRLLLKIWGSSFAAPLLSFVALSSPALASSPILTCKVSGHGGCAHEPGGICVGAGVRDPDITLRVDIRSRRVALNNIKGIIEGNDPIEAAGERRVSWRFDLVRLSHLRALRDGDGQLHLTLTDHSTELEFSCPS